MYIAKVVVNYHFYKTFDYLIPDELISSISRFQRVLVPFRQHKKVGIIVLIDDKSDFDKQKLKSISELLDNKPLFSDNLFKLLSFAANYYHYPLGEVLFDALPPLLRSYDKKIDARSIWQITSTGKNYDLDLLKKSKQQQQLLALMQQNAFVNPTQFSDKIYQHLQQKELICQIDAELINPPSDLQITHSSTITLNDEQKSAVTALNEKIDQFKVFLLDGVTGSGKTEVYIHHIASVLSKGKQALVLVPEIGLSPQTLSRFTARFNVPVMMYNSSMNEKTRLLTWKTCKSKQPCIVIGTRSALFLPFKSLGTIIIDEEHDGSYKQQDGFHYHARDLAIMRAKIENFPILLGSATPSFETLNNAILSRYQHLKLTKKAGDTLQTKQTIIDIRGVNLNAGLSHPLIDKIKMHLANDNQVLLFLNRRGYSPVLMCHDCGYHYECTKCNKPYTYHQDKKMLICHHCHKMIPVRLQCSHCGSTHLITVGVGTEQLESALKALFADIEISRIDSDSTQKKGSLEQYFDKIREGKKHILIGTQMLAKGHHFPNITLVGIINIDSALFSLDFRATEHFAQQYVQVSGRAGRNNKMSEVILQTHQPEHPLLNLLLQKGYHEFAKLTLDERRLTQLPPFSYQAIVHAKDTNNKNALIFLQEVSDYLNAHLKDERLWILGPQPALHAKKAGIYRWQLLLQHDNRAKLQFILTQLTHRIETLASAKKVRWHIDVDPITA